MLKYLLNKSKDVFKAEFELWIVSQTTFIKFLLHKWNLLTLWYWNRLEIQIKKHNVEISKTSDIYKELCFDF